MVRRIVLLSFLLFGGEEDISFAFSGAAGNSQSMVRRISSFPPVISRASLGCQEDFFFGFSLGSEEGISFVFSLGDEEGFSFVFSLGGEGDLSFFFTQ